MRLLTSITVLLLVATLSVQAKAAGLGDIQVFSALSEPLKAEIPIKLNNDNEKNTLSVTLSTDPGFSSADYVQPPTDLALEIAQSKTGEPIVLLTTKAPIVEPAFSVFVLLTTQDSRILREYALLLDWPTERTTPVTAAEVEQTVALQQDSPTVSETVSHRPEPAVQAPINDPGTYVPARQETLWSIANQLRPTEKTSVSVMLKAIADSNPNAFNDGNINSLKSGFVLQIPDNETIARIKHSDAVAFVSEQNTRWANRHSVVASHDANTDSAAEMDNEVGTTDILTSEQTEVNNVTDDLEKQALMKRIASLESQLTTMESMLLEVNKDLAQAQSAQVEPAASGEILQTEDVIQDVVVVETSQENLVVEAPAPKPVVTQPVHPIVPAVVPVQTTEVEQNGLFGFPISVDNIITTLSENNSLIVMGAGVLLLIGAFVTYRAKRNAEEMATNAVVSIPMSEVADQGPLEDAVSVVEAMNSSEDGDEESLDRLVEIDVYLAYGRYSEAEALANEGIAEDHTRVDYHLKLFETYKASGNKTAFESEAESFFSSLATDHPDAWEQIVAMGKQVCPSHPLFVDLNQEQHVDEATLDNSIDNMDSFLQEDNQPSVEASSVDTPESMESPLEDIHNEEPEELVLLEDEPSVEEVYNGKEDTQQNSEHHSSLDEVISSGDSTELVNEIEELSNEFESEEVSLGDEIDVDEEIDVVEELNIVDELAEQIQHEQVVADESNTISLIEDNTTIENTSSVDLDLEDEAYAVSDNIDDNIIEASVDLTDDLLIESAASEFIDNDLNKLIAESDFDNDPLSEFADTVAALEDIENQGEDYGIDAESITLDQEAIETKLDLVRAYIEMDDREEAKRILDEILDEGNDEQKQQAQDLISQIA